MAFFLLCSFTLMSPAYDTNFVEISSYTDKRGITYKFVYMNRDGSGKRIKAKYFAAKDEKGRSVPARYLDWYKDKNVITLTSAGYMDGSVPPVPVGLTIDNGRIVNRNIEDFDALVIVYATGGIVATNLDNADLTLQGGGITPGRRFDIRGNFRDREDFIEWAQSEEATVFQTHLLVYKNELTIDSRAEPTPKKRRFLAVGKDNSGQVCHVIVHSPEITSLLVGTQKVKNFLNDYKDMDITFMINVDTGIQDVFFLFNSDGSLNNSITGSLPVNNAANILTYYYE
jgi:hypothetical protein